LGHSRDLNLSSSICKITTDLPTDWGEWVLPTDLGGWILPMNWCWWVLPTEVGGSLQENHYIETSFRNQNN